MLVDSEKMNQIIVKQAQNKKNPTDIFLICLHFAEELATIKRDFGEKLDQQLKYIIMKFVDISEEPQGSPLRRGHLDHKLKITRFPSRQRRNIICVQYYEELNRHCTELFKEVKVRVSSSPYICCLNRYGSKIR
jgi:hypothetical protein